MGDLSDHPFGAANFGLVLGLGEFGGGLESFLKGGIGAVHLLGDGLDGAASEEWNRAAEDECDGAAGEGGNGHNPAPGAFVRCDDPVEGHHQEHGGEEDGAGAGEAGLEADAAFVAEDGVEFGQHLSRHGGRIAWVIHNCYIRR